MGYRRRIGAITACLLAAFLLSAPQLGASPTTPEQARQVVENWLSLEARPLGADLFRSVQQVTAYPQASSQPTITSFP